jgi:hypothetical protein
MINGKKILRISAKIFLWVIGIFLILFSCIWIVLKVPRVQNYLVKKVTSYVQTKTHTRVELKYIDIGFPKSILLQGIFLEDQQHDTLLSLKELDVDVNMLALLNRTISVQRLKLDQPNVHLIRNERDSSFNFQFFIDAFTTPDKDSVVTDTSASKPWEIKAKNVSLENLKFQLNDSLSGLNVSVTAGHLSASLKKLDLEGSSINLGAIELSDARTTVLTTKNFPSDTTAGSTSWNGVALSEISIKNSSFAYNDIVSAMLVKVQVGELALEKTALDLSKQAIISKGLFLSKTSSFIQLKKEQNSSEQNNTSIASTSENNWKIEVASVEMKNNSFLMDITNEKKISSGIDWNHLFLSGITTSIDDIFYNGTEVKAKIGSLTIQEKSGFGIRSLHADASFSSTQASVKDFELITNYSRIGQELKMKYNSLNEIMSSSLLQCSMSNNRFAVRELLLLVPELDTVEIIHKNKDRIINFSLDAKGSMKYLNVNKLSLETLHSNIQTKGTLKFLNEPNKLWMDLDIKKIETGSSDLSALLPDSIVPGNIHIPDSLFLKGNFKGSLSEFQTEGFLTSSYGIAKVNLNIKDLRKESPVYNVVLSTSQFSLGKLLGQASLGKINGNIEVSGTGFDTTTAIVKIKADIASIGIDNYDYKSIKFKASMDKTLINAKGAVIDSNLNLKLDAKIDLSKDHEFYDLQLDLKGADFYGLGYTKDHINMMATTDVHLIGDPRKNIDGHIASRNILIIKNGKRYKTDSLVFVSLNEGGHRSMKLSSSMVAATFEGNIDIVSIGPAVTNHLNRYFQYTESKFKKTNPQNFTFEFQLNDSPLLRDVIFPPLKEYNPLHIKGSFDSEEAKLVINAEIPFVTYDGFTINECVLAVDSDINKLDYTANWNYFKTDGITIENTTLAGKVAFDTASINLQIKNKKMEEKVLLRTYVTKASKDHYRFSIFKNGLSFQGKGWTVYPKNYIEFGPKYLFADQFKFTHNEQSIHLQSSAEGEDMALSFTYFNLHILSQIFEDDNLLVKGRLDGDVKLKNFLHNPAFTSELKVQDFVFKKSRIGNLHITADNLTAERYTAKVELTDSINKATISGYYLTTQGKDALHFNADLKIIELASLEAFSGGQITASTGFVKGAISITGEMKNPKFNGEVSFVEASTKVSYLNQRLSIKKEAITISPERITFNSFKIIDSLNNEALIKGYVGIESLDNVSFHLNITTKNFMILNTTAVNNKLYYGRVILNSRFSVSGTQNFPVIKADIDIVGGSHFTFAIPDSKITADRGEGIVIFTSDSSSLNPIMLRQQEVIVQKVTGLDITANVSIDRNSTLKILVDPISGDSLSVRGNADLNFRMDATGQTSLNGRYVVNDGSYKASLENLIVRRFKIVKGSTIIWSGDPLEALVDVTATYSIKTPPEGLLVSNMGVDSSALRKPLPFTVIMMMQGELLKPVISFKLDMPDNAKGAVGGEVYSKITEINANESEINKQVFALLILNRFIAPDNSGTTSTSDFARRSVSRMMSNELSKLSSKYVHGLQIDVDVQSYNDINNGQQQGNTQLEVGVTKNLLDERLSVQVGTNVAIEGQNSTSGSNAKNFTGDIVVEYKLTRSGRYKVKAFRTNQYDGISNGTIVQTGVGLVFTRNFTHSRELFSSRKKKKKK